MQAFGKLMREDYPPPLILREWRLGYLQALTAADGGNRRRISQRIDAKDE